MVKRSLWMMIGQMLVTLALLLHAASAFAQHDAAILRFGGSAPDQINEIAVTGDGRLVMAGWTGSSDGTLSDRTKSGQSGWVALVDLQGNTCWNFCSRYGSDDRMMAPVVHEDGTITVLLNSNGNRFRQIELIRLDMDGQVISRRTLVRLEQERSGCAPEYPGVFSGGYVIATYDLSSPVAFEPIYRYSDGVVYQPVYHWFDFDGNPLFSTQTLWQGSIAQVSENHVIEAIDQTYWLCALDGQGNHTKLVSLYDGLRANMAYHDLISLPDGGAAACRSQMIDGQKGSLIQRWDAQGKTVYEIGMKGYQANHVQRLGDMLIVCGEIGGRNELLVLNARGEVLECHEAGEVLQTGRALAVLDDGTVLMAGKVEGEMTDSQFANWDVQISVMQIGKEAK